MAESQKLRSLRQIHENLVKRRYTEPQLNSLQLADCEGRMVKFSDDSILTVVEARIAAEEAES